MPQMDLNRVRDILYSDKKFDKDILNICVIPKIGKSEIVKLHKDQAIQLFQ